jgi:hypothetical protein
VQGARVFDGAEGGGQGRGGGARAVQNLVTEGQELKHTRRCHRVCCNHHQHHHNDHARAFSQQPRLHALHPLLLLHLQQPHPVARPTAARQLNRRAHRDSVHCTCPRNTGVVLPPSSCSFTGSSMPRSMQERTDGRMGGGQGTSSRVSPELVVGRGG